MREVELMMVGMMPAMVAVLLIVWLGWDWSVPLAIAGGIGTEAAFDIFGRILEKEKEEN